MSKIDLHIHTTASDGRLSAEEIVNLAIKKRMKVIAITDHNSIDSISKAIEYVKKYAKNKIELIPGIELNCHEKDVGFDEVHIIGLYINQKNKEIKKFSNLGFNKFINKISISEAIRIIKKAGGLAFLAHPGVYNKKDSLELIDLFIKKGGDGIETIYPYDKVFPYKYDEKKTNEKIKFFTKIAKEKNLLQTGGSDFHGRFRKINLGGMNISYSLLKKIKEKRGKRLKLK